MATQIEKPQADMSDDEISVSEIFFRIWSGRGLILLAVTVALVASSIYVGYAALNAYRPVQFYVGLKNIANQSYPNGAAFTPQDFLITEVTNEVRTRFNLPENSDITRATSVRYNSPITEGLTQNYRLRLSARTLTQAEIAEINREFIEAVDAAMKSTVQITIDYATLGVSAETGLSIAAEIPKIWSKVYTENFRIFSNPTIANFTVSLKDESLINTSSILTANTQVAAIKSGLRLLAEDNRLSLLKTKTGVSPADLEVELNRFETTLFNPIKASKLQTGGIVAETYISTIELNVADLKRRVEVYDQSLRELAAFGGQRAMSTADQPQSLDQRQSIQLSDGAFNEIVKLAERSSFSDFIKETLISRTETKFQLSTLTKELELAQTKSTLEISTDFQREASASLAEIKSDYSEMLKMAEIRLSERGGELYVPTLGPYVSEKIVTIQNLLVVAVVTLAAFFVSAMGVLTWSFIRKRRAP